MWPKAEGIVGSMSPFFPYHPGTGVLPVAFAWFFSSMGIGLWTSGHPGPQP